jgi:hypothetical protein
MRLLRSFAFGLLVAGGTYCVGFVVCRLGHELYPYEGPVFDALLPGLVAVASVTGGFFGYRSRNTRLRSLVLAVTFVVTLTSFYAMAVKLVDEHHSTAYRQQQNRWTTFVRVIQRNAFKKNTCEQTLLQERFAMSGDLTPSDANAIRHYCSTWGRNLESVHFPITEFWKVYDKQENYPLSRDNDDA